MSESESSAKSAYHEFLAHDRALDAGFFSNRNKFIHSPPKAATFPQGDFYIRCHKNGLLLDVERSSSLPNASIVSNPPRSLEDPNCQVWTAVNGFLINKFTGYVLSLKRGKLEPEAPVVQSERKIILQEALSQIWGYDNGFIYIIANPGLVLDIVCESNRAGANLCVWNRKSCDNENQLFDLEPVDMVAGKGATNLPATEALMEARHAVYAGKKRGRELTAEMISWAAGCQVVQYLLERQQHEGKTVIHQIAKDQIAAEAASEVGFLAVDYEFEGDLGQVKMAASATALAFYDRQIDIMYSAYLP